MDDNNDLTVGGYTFLNIKDADMARNEIKKINYIESHTDMANLSYARKVYEKAIEDRYFKTPIGIEYLRNIQKELMEDDIDANSISPIPLYGVYASADLNEDHLAKRKVEAPKEKENSLKIKYRNAVLIAIIFAVLSFALVVITLNGTTPNALNYKKAILNEYSAWEEELTEREAAVRAKERELNIDN